MFVRRAWLAFFLRGGCSLHCVGWRVGLAPRIVPSVEQANSAIFCSRMSQILHHVHSRRLAHTQTVPEHQEGSFPFGNAAGFLVLGVSLEQLKGDLFGPQCTAQMGKSPRVSELVMHVQKIKQLLTRWKGLLHRFQKARREGGEKTKVQPEREKKKPCPNKKWGENWQESDEEEKQWMGVRKWRNKHVYEADQAVQEQIGVNINLPGAVLAMKRHLLSYFGCRQDTHLIPVTSLTPTQSLTASQLLWLPHDTFVLALKWWPSTAV